MSAMQPASASASGPVPVQPLPAAPLVLQYDTGRPSVRRAEVALFLPATLAGAVAAFLPFTYDVTPFGVVLHTGELLTRDADVAAVLIALLAWTFLVPVLLLPLRLRVLLVGPSSRLERRIAYGVAGVAAAAVVTCLGIMIPRVEHWDELTITAAGAASVAAGALIFIRVARGNPDKAAVAAMLAPYVANSAIVLVGFAGDRDPGWYVTLAAAGAALAELILLASTSGRTRPA
jgi:hypothetical protein